MLVTMPIFQDGPEGFLVARVLPQDTPLSPMPSFTGNTVAVDRAAGRWSFRRFTLRSRDIQTIPFSLLRIKFAAIWIIWFEGNPLSERKSFLFCSYQQWFSEWKAFWEAEGAHFWPSYLRTKIETWIGDPLQVLAHQTFHGLRLHSFVCFQSFKDT